LRVRAEMKIRKKVSRKRLHLRERRWSRWPPKKNKGCRRNWMLLLFSSCLARTCVATIVTGGRSPPIDAALPSGGCFASAEPESEQVPFLREAEKHELDGGRKMEKINLSPHYSISRAREEAPKTLSCVSTLSLQCIPRPISRRVLARGQRRALLLQREDVEEKRRQR